MNRLAHTKMNAVRRKIRVRQTVSGTTQRPRLAVFVSNRHIVAQVINDETMKTLASATSVGVKELDKKTMTDKAAWVGEQIAASAKKAKVSRVVFDRSGKLYHGKVKALAESARKNGLEF
jgi:large subunit ribosomal protein L18